MQMWRWTAAALSPLNAMEWQMSRVVSIQARVQRDKPVWDTIHRVFVSSVGTTFDDRYAATLDTVNLASVEGVLKYVQSEGINQHMLNPASCERKNNMQFIVLYEITLVQPTTALAVFQTDGNLVPEYGPFVAMDGGMCTSVVAHATVLPDDCIRMFGSATLPAVGPYVGAGTRSEDPRAPYPNTIWFSYPNSCVMQPWASKTPVCRNAFRAGLCPFGVAPNGINCTFAYTVLGFLRLDDLVGITNLTHSLTRQPYSSYFEFCKDTRGQYQGVEFKAPDGVYDNKAVTSLPFWSEPYNPDANRKRAEAVVDMYNARIGTIGAEHMRALPAVAALHNPPCYVNAKQCADAPFGCKRHLLAQVCQVCGGPDAACVKAPPGYHFPTLSVPTLAPAPRVEPNVSNAVDVHGLPSLAQPSGGMASFSAIWSGWLGLASLAVAGATWP
ncbi:hypothetical protein H310_07916 [Aphanomyces invadans]|uniref:Uncharacterized protein n=1 Tax=Aphanomyces invadans TaxID=157072 RepID=A0A024U1X4_9STRA|nr:hypothetical protein H310_07916 [Aphanomyces invadans]ETV99881.1 hypothetical protein H310_07916 [Aphanomyces invadans]|eukprot:XP_008871657.1 hypothetical protein H310_07916 [Aphanomyces invadans]